MPELEKARVLVSPTSFGLHDPALKDALATSVGEVVYNTTGRPLTSTELLEMLPGCDGFIAGLDSIDRTAIEAADRLQVIARYGVGIDNVDLEAARERGIVVTNTPGANSASVAELTVGLILSLARPIPSAALATRAGEWPRTPGLTLEGRTVGLIGFGAIGRQVARRLRGFGCRLVAHDPIPDEAAARELDVELVALGEVQSAADFLSLHCPVNPETKAMVDEVFLDQMKHGAFLVNTARGELIDEPALVAAIESGQIRGAALDVFAQQPPEPDNPLLSLDTVIATPHMASHTDGATTAMGWGALNDCLAVLRGEQPLHRVV